MRDPGKADYSDLVVGDFGIAKMLETQDQFLKTTAGSYGYAAPEVIMKQPYGKACDLWSIGVISYVL